MIAAGNQSAAPIVIAIGSNLAGPFGSPVETCRRAVVLLAALPALRQVGQSAWYDTEPVPRSMQPNFINGVATFVPLVVDLDPARLLGMLQRIEADGGRTRGTPDAPRTLDLDIVTIGDVVRETPDPVLPHPRAHTRRFVLEPLRDVLPGWRHPVLRSDVDAMIAALPEGGTRRLAVGEVR